VLSLTIKSRLQDLNVAQLAAFGGAPDTISGTLTGAGTFSGSGTDVAAVLKSARGNGTATIANGAIRRLNLVRTVVLFFGRPAPDSVEGTDQFERIDASFSLANQILRAEPLSLRSRDADIVGSVTLNLNSQALDGALDMSLSEELSKQAGTDLARFTREGNRVVLPGRIGGTIAAPRLTIDAAAAAKRGLRNEVERRLKGFLEGFGR
jgi:AsmA-like C-terminal region